MPAAIEDVLFSISDESLAARALSANDDLDVELNSFFPLPMTLIQLSDTAQSGDAPQ